VSEAARVLESDPATRVEMYRMMVEARSFEKRVHDLFPRVEENPRLCGWGAEVASIVVEERFFELDGPTVRITTPHIPLPAADSLEDLAIPSADVVVERVRAAIQQ
jgi:pyruvate/2-oxoglutarate/acetoin dehydrogenase E1 component